MSLLNRLIRRRVWSAGALVIAVIGCAWALVGRTSAHRDGEVGTPSTESARDGDAARITTIRPKKDANFRVGVQQLASVQPYFQAELKTRIAGPVRVVKVDIGDAVKKGDLLAEIDVPDMRHEVDQKSATVDQRRQELKVSQAKVLTAEAFVEVAKTTIDQQRASVIQAEASRDYRKKRLDRYHELLKRQAINDDLVDEQEKEWRSGEAAWQFAIAGVDRAQADLKEKLANLATARADEDLKRSQIDVAQFDLERSKDLAGYARITAPFDGVVLRRNVDPGDLVQNATTGASEPLFTLARIDVVKVVAKIPDNAAAYVSTGTPVEIQIDQIPGATLKAKVSRASPSIDSADRTMRIEVDLVNSKGEICHDDLTDEQRKACLANSVESVLGDRKILPGMNGYVRVQFSGLGESYLVPSSAVFSRGGKQYVMTVEEGKIRKFPAVVQANDGKTAKISVLRRDAQGKESLVELNGREDIVANRQSELEEGQEVSINSKDW